MENHEQLVRRILKGQQAPLIDGERHILVKCSQCDRTWLMQGAHTRLFPEREEALQWAERLGADLGDLPSMTCWACAVRANGGDFTFEEYADPAGRIRGYGYSWEALSPPSHMLMGVVLLTWLQTSPPQERYSNVVTNPPLARAVLSWLDERTRRGGLLYRPFSPGEIEVLTLTNPPAVHAPGTEGWVWRGGAWQGQCDPLGGMAYVTFAWAGPSTALSALSPALAEWHTVAQRAQQHNIAGES